MSDTPLGAFPPKEFEWALGKTAASIDYVRQIEEFIRSRNNNENDMEVLFAKEAMRLIKDGELVLDQYRNLQTDLSSRKRLFMEAFQSLSG